MLARLRLTTLLTLSALSLLPAPARAESPVPGLVQQLKTAPPPGRIQAAASLGASGDEAAVNPLCAALGDTEAVVREAAAAALGKLGKAGGLFCLRAAAAKESTPAVKAQIAKSIVTLETPPPPGPGTKVYVAIEVKNKSGRPNAEVDALVRATMQAKILGLKGFAVAPANETAEQAAKVVKAKRLKSFVLTVTVNAPEYADNKLTQLLNVLLATYPDRELKGAYNPKITQSEVPKRDPQSEAELIQACAETAVESVKAAVAVK